MFLDTAARLDARDALEWIQRFRTETMAGLRRDELALRAGEIYLHYLDQPEQAIQIFDAFKQRDGWIGQLARVQRGDAALMAGELNEAVEHYAEAQNRARAMRNQPVRSSRDRPAPGDTAERMEQLLRQMGRTVVGLGTEHQDWRLHAMLDATASETVRSLLAQAYFPEAREALRLWILSAPISRVSADQIVVESRWWNEIDDHHRASNLLQAFCDTVEASPYLPEAAVLALHTMQRAEWPDEERRAFGKRMASKLEFHPVAERITRFGETGDETLWTVEEMDEWYRTHVSPGRPLLSTERAADENDE